MGWISFFADICSEMVYPVIPLFLRGALKAPAVALGLVEGVAEGIVSFMKGWSGMHSDRTGKRLPYIQWGYGLSAIGKPLLALAYAWPMVLVGRVVDRFGKGLRTTARDALIADSVETEDLGRAFGFHRAMDTAGALVGVFLGFVLLALLPGEFRLIFVLAGIPGAFAVLLTLRLREPFRFKSDAATLEPESSGGMAESLRGLPQAYWHAFWLSILFALANTSDMFLMARATDLGLAPTSVILAYAMYNVTYTALSYPMGALSDRIGRWPVVGGGWILYALVYIGFATIGPGQAIALWPLFAVYGIYQAMAQGATKALVAEHSPKNRRGAALGFFYMASGFATIGGNLIAGLLWDRVSPAAAFYTGGGLALLSALAIPFVIRTSKRSTLNT